MISLSLSSTLWTVAAPHRLRGVPRLEHRMAHRLTDQHGR
jgi:hypothetical protein